MPILTRPIKTTVIALISFSISGCDRPSDSYKHIKRLPESQWENYASTLPLSDRLNLHKEIMTHAGHNPSMTILGSFSKQPFETYQEIVARLSNGDASPHYVSVLYEINRSPNFRICSQRNRKLVQRYLWANATTEVEDRHRPAFYSC